MRITRYLWLLTLPLLNGCQYLPHSTFFKAPEHEPNPAWVRIVNFTQHAALYQYDGGVKTGGVIRRGELPFVHTQDIGMPKAGQDLTFDYYETTVRPGLETDVYMNWKGSRTEFCHVTAKFTPQAGRYYQFVLTSASSTGTCRLSPTLIERDGSAGDWRLIPNPDVSYPQGSNTGTTVYGNEMYRNPDYKRGQPAGYP
ncbi:hypothetical protein SJI00_08020 [Pseudomonas sp. RP23018S]|uniref:hypothetical protein n=1 Tax=Pseudomonas sp. RP23018S TaxID=3096037 RepID=UPI002ACA99D3|nr:hypothetical protein [Pseudomonas sp. RP23018S]MDZ5602717.1 hypothetical protein [Pseudomonas sp. RP23018S]